MIRTIVETCREFYHSFNFLQNKDPKQSVHQDDKLVKRFHPAILFLTEVDPTMLELSIPARYKFHKGTLQDHDVIRVSILIKVTVPYKTIFPP